MKRKNITTKAMTMAVAMSMVAGLCPSTVFAATGSEVAKDGVYTSTKHVTRTQEDVDDENGWTEYDVQVDLKVENGKFSDIVVTPLNGYDEVESKTYFTKAYNKSKGIKTLLVGQAATEDTIKSWDTVSQATRTSAAVKEAALEAIHSAPVAVTVDTAALEQAIASAKALNQADYTAESWQAMQNALTAAESALTAKESQEAVDQAKATLDAAKAALVKAEQPVSIDTSSLEKAISDAETLKEADYTADSWKAMQTALTKAKSALQAKDWLRSPARKHKQQIIQRIRQTIQLELQQRQVEQLLQKQEM